MQVPSAVGLGVELAKLNWPIILGIPATAVAVLALASYAVGLIHPLTVKKAQYWHAANTTQFSCVIGSRTWLRDLSVTSLVLVAVPTGWRRLFGPFWRRAGQEVTDIPWGNQIGVLRENE